jgi:hypothetical protein
MTISVLFMAGLPMVSVMKRRLGASVEVKPSDEGSGSYSQRTGRGEGG